MLLDLFHNGYTCLYINGLDELILDQLRFEKGFDSNPAKVFSPSTDFDFDHLSENCATPSHHGWS